MAHRISQQERQQNQQRNQQRNPIINDNFPDKMDDICSRYKIHVRIHNDSPELQKRIKMIPLFKGDGQEVEIYIKSVVLVFRCNQIPDDEFIDLVIFPTLRGKAFNWMQNFCERHPTSSVKEVLNSLHAEFELSEMEIRLKGTMKQLGDESLKTFLDGVVNKTTSRY